MDNYPDRFIPLYIHRADAYPTAWGDSRAPFYQVQGYPTPIYDGILDPYYEGWALGYPYPFTQYMPIALDDRLQVTTDVTIDVETWGGGINWSAKATICIEAGGTGKTMRLHMVRFLDHHPAGQSYYRNCVMEGAQLPDLTLAPGECAVVEQAYVLDTASATAPENVGIAVFAQDPLSVWPADIHQGAQAIGTPTGILEDGFESGDTTAWSGVAP